MIRFLTTALTCGVLVLISLSTDRACADDQASIVGVWRVKSFVRKEVGTDKSVQPYGEHPTGYRMHTKGGYVSYMFVSDSRKAPEGSVTDADRIQMFNTINAATGTYKIEGDKVLFHADEAISQSFKGQNLTYTFKIEGKNLTMVTDPIKSPSGGEIVNVTTYERAE
jgi:hypothetical protein